MAQLKAGQVERVLSSLYEYNDSTKEVKPLTKQTADRYRKRFRMFPVLDYSRQFFSFQLEGCNDVRYNVTWAKAEQTGTDSPAKTAYMFNPVKVDGSWEALRQDASRRDRPRHEITCLVYETLFTVTDIALLAGWLWAEHQESHV